MNPSRPGQARPQARPPARRVPAKAKLPARKPFRRDFAVTVTLIGLLFGLTLAFVYGLYAPKAQWAFDRPEAKLPSLQSHHTLQ